MSKRVFLRLGYSTLTLAMADPLASVALGAARVYACRGTGHLAVCKLAGGVGGPTTSAWTRWGIAGCREGTPLLRAFRIGLLRGKLAPHHARVSARRYAVGGETLAWGAGSRRLRQARSWIRDYEMGVYEALVVGRMLPPIAAVAVHPVDLRAVNPGNRLTDAGPVLHHHSRLQIVVHKPTYSV